MAKFTARLIGPTPTGYAVRGKGTASSKRVAAQRAVENLFEKLGVKNDAADSFFPWLRLHVTAFQMEDARVVERACEGGLVENLL